MNSHISKRQENIFRTIDSGDNNSSLKTKLEMYRNSETLEFPSIQKKSRDDLKI